MAFKQQVTASAVVNTTSKTAVDTVVVPQGVTKIVGVAGMHMGAATLTTGQPLTGMYELESDDIPITPAQFLMDGVNVLTSGAFSLKPTQWPCDISVVPGARIRVFAQLDMAQTGSVRTRVQITYA